MSFFDVLNLLGGLALFLFGMNMMSDNLQAVAGKIMRRILKKVAANEIGDIGDTTTLADPSVVDDIVKNRL